MLPLASAFGLRNFCRHRRLNIRDEFQQTLDTFRGAEHGYIVRHDEVAALRVEVPVTLIATVVGLDFADIVEDDEVGVVDAGSQALR